MLNGLTGVSLAAGDGDWMNTYGWALLLVAAMFVMSLYVWSYVSKQFSKLASKEGKYLDSDVAIFLDHMVKSVIIILLSFMSCYVASLVWAEFNDAVCTRADAGGLDIKNDQRTVKLDGEHGAFHGRAESHGRGTG